MTRMGEANADVVLDDDLDDDEEHDDEEEGGRWRQAGDDEVDTESRIWRQQ